MDKIKKIIKKLSLKKGDIIIAHYDLRETLQRTTLPKEIDFEVPIIFTDDINKIAIK